MTECLLPSVPLSSAGLERSIDRCCLIEWMQLSGGFTQYTIVDYKTRCRQWVTNPPHPSDQPHSSPPLSAQPQAQSKGRGEDMKICPGSRSLAPELRAVPGGLRSLPSLGAVIHCRHSEGNSIFPFFLPLPLSLQGSH